MKNNTIIKFEQCQNGHRGPLVSIVTIFNPTEQVEKYLNWVYSRTPLPKDRTPQWFLGTFVQSTQELIQCVKVAIGETLNLPE